MHTMLDELIRLVPHAPVVLARVVDTTGASPREPGASMVLSSTGEVLGSLSGGCIESAVLESAAQVLATGQPVIDRFGYADHDGIEVGLTCGGEMEIFVERLDSTHRDVLVELRNDIAAGLPVAQVTTLDTAAQWKLLRQNDNQPWCGVDQDVRALLDAGHSGIVSGDDCAVGLAPRPRVFVHTFAAPARMILAGANDFVRALSRIGRQLGYRVTVVDARETFATPSRFPVAHEVVVDWPHRYLMAELAGRRVDHRTVVCVLTHDNKFDVPMLAAALKASELGFVGALGSRRTHAERIERLRTAGVTAAELARLKSPVGLDLNARTPDETAISVAAQILAERGGGSARPLTEADGPLHY